MKTYDDEEQMSRDDIAEAIRGSGKPTGSRIEKLRWIVEHQTAARIEGKYVDLFTASAVVKVHDALNEANQANFVAKPLGVMVALTWKLLKR